VKVHDEKHGGSHICLKSEFVQRSFEEEVATGTFLFLLLFIFLFDLYFSFVAVLLKNLSFFAGETDAASFSRLAPSLLSLFHAADEVLFTFIHFATHFLTDFLF
jgi:hypothetical protein